MKITESSSPAFSTIAINLTVHSMEVENFVISNLIQMIFPNYDQKSNCYNIRFKIKKFIRVFNVLNVFIIYEYCPINELFVSPINQVIGRGLTENEYRNQGTESIE